MKKYKLLSVILLGVVVFNCDTTKKEDLFTIDQSKFKSEYTNSDAIELNVTNSTKKTVDSVVYFMNNKKLGSKKGTEKGSFHLKNQKLGHQTIKALVYFENDTISNYAKIEIVSNVQPKLLKYNILHTFPHDTTSFTEGLEFYKGDLYEGTGLRGKSKLLKTDYKTGTITKSVALENQYFGEGITFINNKIFQLTWEEKVGFIYDATTMKLEKTFTYDKPIEGWGLTNDGKTIYRSDGTEKIWTMNPDTQKLIDFVNVYSASSKIPRINELEFIDGKIYANIWQKDAVAIVNPTTGAVEGIIDFSGLRKLLKAKQAEVLNGIAYNPATKTIFITGKNWDKLFEVEIKN
jgi:glutaminyl-peptide cyclotransferase